MANESGSYASSSVSDGFRMMSGLSGAGLVRGEDNFSIYEEFRCRVGDLLKLVSIGIIAIVLNRVSRTGVDSRELSDEVERHVGLVFCDFSFLEPDVRTS